MAEPRERVLVVDDEVPILLATRDLLRELECDVETHADPASVLEKVREVRPSVLLQDVRMPGLDVRRLVAELRGDERTRGTRVVLFSASVEATELGQELGLRVLQKPFKPAALLAAIRGT